MCDAKLCFARKVGRFARKIGRLASKRHTWHMERASGNALQAWTKGPYDTIATLLSGLSSSKNPALKVGRDCHNPTASFNSLPNVLVRKSAVTARSWLTSGTLHWSWTPRPPSPQVLELLVVKLRFENYYLLQKIFT